jgi:hypothetical protein
VSSGEGEKSENVCLGKNTTMLIQSKFKCRRKNQKGLLGQKHNNGQLKQNKKTKQEKIQLLVGVRMNGQTT